MDIHNTNTNTITKMTDTYFVEFFVLSEAFESVIFLNHVRLTYRTYQTTSLFVYEMQNRKPSRTGLAYKHK